LTLALFVCGSLVVFTCSSIGAEPLKTKKKILVFGDSLTAGYQLPANSSFPVVLERFLNVRGHPVQVTNASVSGDTATAGLERLEWSLGDGADLVLLELGANDMLRGIDVETTYKALNSILLKLREKKIPVLLAGMRASRGLGSEYSNQFDSMYPQLASKHGVRLYPFFLEGVVGRADLNLPDGIHPNTSGIQLIVEQIGPVVIDMLQKLDDR
jgi:acyl-CoA thioesterase-1